MHHHVYDLETMTHWWIIYFKQLWFYPSRKNSADGARCVTRTKCIEMISNMTVQISSISIMLAGSYFSVSWHRNMLLIRISALLMFIIAFTFDCTLDGEPRRLESEICIHLHLDCLILFTYISFNWMMWQIVYHSCSKQWHIDYHTFYIFLNLYIVGHWLVHPLSLRHDK